MVVSAAPLCALLTTIYRHDDAEQPNAAGTPQPQEEPTSPRKRLHLGGADDRDCDCWNPVGSCFTKLP